MPIYKYQCPKCNHLVEEYRDATDRNEPMKCEICGSTMERIYGIPIIEYRDDTTGWAKRIYQKGSKDYIKYREETNYEKVYNNKKIFNKLPRQTQIQYEREMRNIRGQNY
jgi:putative FmdB family regulatory protein